MSHEIVTLPKLGVYSAVSSKQVAMRVSIFFGLTLYIYVCVTCNYLSIYLSIYIDGVHTYMRVSIFYDIN